MNIVRTVIGGGSHAARCLIRKSAYVPFRQERLLKTLPFHSRPYATQKQPKQQKSSTEPQEASVLTTPQKVRQVASTGPQVPKKRVQTKKKRMGDRLEEVSAQGLFNVTAFATAEEYDLEKLCEGLKEQDLYETKAFFSSDKMYADEDVLYVTAKYQVDEEAREIFFFRKGSVVLWNFTEIESNNVLSFLRPYEKDSYRSPLVRGESEVMPYTYVQSEAEEEVDSSNDSNACGAFLANGKFHLTCNDSYLQKYTFSDAMGTSIKLGIWEATLDLYIDSMSFVTDDLKKGRRIRMSRPTVLRKTGELFALRHVINLSSDCLDTPDFYWDREELEALYNQTAGYFNISRRTKVMNEKINHCLELAELIAHNLNDKHHIRLEWMIIILIMVEVAFEIVHYKDRLYGKEAAQDVAD